MAGNTDRFRRRLLAGVLTALVAGNATWGQRGRVLGQTEMTETPTSGFVLPKADTKTIDTLDDFKRYIAKKAWEQAFRAFNTIIQADNMNMIPAEDGFLLPLKQQVIAVLAAMPPEGKEAYRLFYDAKAKQLFEPLADPKRVPTTEDVKTLRKIVDQYLITSVGDMAADCLADTYFEAGDFGSAEALWQMLARDFPDGKVPNVRVQAKRAVALARLHRREELRQLAATLKEQAAGQVVRIGGQDVVASEFVAALLREENTTQPSGEGETLEVALPPKESPIWQVRILPPETAEQMDRQIRDSGWSYYGIRYSGMIPSSAFDGQRMYLQWMGTVCATDLRTGKMVWRTGKFNDVTDKAVQIIQYGVMPERFALSAFEGKVFAVGRNIQSLGSRGDNYTLTCYDGESGKVKWNSDTLGANIDFIGAPYVFDHLLYAVTTSSSNETLYVLNPDTGKQEWKLVLGAPRVGSNYRGNNTYSVPLMAMGNGVLYLSTNNGALLAINVSQRRIEWAFQNETKPLGDEQRIWVSDSYVLPFETPGTLIRRDGMLYLKDSSAATLYAIDPAAMTLRWKRAVASEEMVAAMDEKAAYLLGHELSALDLKTRQLRWSTKIPVNTGDLRAMLAGKHLYVLSSRGIFDIDTANGDTLRIFRGIDREGASGRLYMYGDKLICVTANAVTAYPVEPAGR